MRTWADPTGSMDGVPIVTLLAAFTVVSSRVMLTVLRTDEQDNEEQSITFMSFEVIIILHHYNSSPLTLQ